MSRNIASTKCRKIGGLRNYQRGENLKKGEVNFERGGSDPLGNYAYIHDFKYDPTTEEFGLQRFALERFRLEGGD